MSMGLIRQIMQGKGKKLPKSDRQHMGERRIVGIIARRPKGLADGEYNPLRLAFVVSHYRKDRRHGPTQTTIRGQYCTDLHNLYFKNWDNVEQWNAPDTKGAKRNGRRTAKQAAAKTTPAP